MYLSKIQVQHQAPFMVFKLREKKKKHSNKTPSKIKHTYVSNFINLSNIPLCTCSIEQNSDQQ
jgi:hypothetical protein